MGSAESLTAFALTASCLGQCLRRSVSARRAGTCHVASAMLSMATIALAATACTEPPKDRWMTDEERTTLPTLRIGDRAPSIESCTFVQGEPVPIVERGKVQVLEFWSPGCGPCIDAMSHLSELQDRFGDQATIISVGTVGKHISAEDVRRVVAAQRDRLRVRVAIDVTQEGTVRYQIATRSSSIPRAFLIDRAGRLAWVGHPNDLDGPLAAVVDESWDLEAEARESARRHAIALATRCIVQEYVAAAVAKDDEAILRAAESFSRYPVADADGYAPAWWAWPTRVKQLVKLGRPEEATKVARMAMAVPGVSDDPSALSELASVLVPAEKAQALAVADQAIALIREQEKEMDADILASPDRAARLAYRRFWHASVMVELARVMSAGGRPEDAVECQRFGLRRWKEHEQEGPTIQRLEQDLAAYEVAAANLANH